LESPVSFIEFINSEINAKEASSGLHVIGSIIACIISCKYLIRS